MVNTTEILDSQFMHSLWLTVTIEDVSKKQGISVHDYLDYSKISCQWVSPRQCKASYCSKNNKTINQVSWEKLPHSWTSPNMAPTDFHLAGCLKEFHHGRKFSSDDEVKSIMCK